jgi:DNA polymerase II small subunit/DNA polymerase delta subunit B
MNRKEIISMFLKTGNQLDISALEYFEKNPKDVDIFIEKLKTLKQPPIVTSDFIEGVLGPKQRLDIIKRFSTKNKKDKISISDYSKIFLDLYNELKSLIIEKVDSTKLVSINKIQKQTDFVIICMVRSKNPTDQSILVEDLTGQANIFFKKDEFETLYEDDVVGIECEKSDSDFSAKKIIWPDIPFEKTIPKTKSDVHAIFVSDIHLDSANFDEGRYNKLIKSIGDEAKIHDQLYVFILGGISKRQEDIDSFFRKLPQNTSKIFLRSRTDAKTTSNINAMVSDSPIMVDIRGVTVLLCQGDGLYEYKPILGQSGAEVMVNIIKRRNLMPHITNEHIRVLDPQIIDPVPNIFASGSFHSAESTNYKGMTILTTGDVGSNPVFFSINLKTREINKVDIS